MQEYANTLTLEDHEIDLAVDFIRKKLMKVARGGNGPPNKFRENRILTQIFQTINTGKTGILTVDEFLALAHKLEVFLTEQEAHRGSA